MSGSCPEGLLGGGEGESRFMFRTLPSGEIDPGLFVANARLVDRDRDALGAVFVKNGKIVAVYEGEEATRMLEELDGAAIGCGSEHGPGMPEILDAGGAALMPAFVDLHAHFRDPGFTAKEDLESGSRAAVAGGYGTVVLMANTDPVTSSAETAAEINARARSLGLVETFQAVSLTRGFDGRDVTSLKGLDRRLVPVASEDGRDVSDPDVMRAAMRACAETGVVVSCHCEDAEIAVRAKPLRSRALASIAAGNVDAARADLAEAESVLREAEDAMTERNLSLATESGCRVHITHASTAGAIDAVRRAKKAARARAASGTPIPVTCDVTPHHLSLTSASLEIVNPPLRPEADRLSLIAGVVDGTIDAIATDHAPHTARDKAAGAPGFSGIQTAFSVCYDALVRAGHIGLSRLSALMSANPAEILGLPRGLLRAGFDADLVLVDLGAQTVVDPTADAWRSKGQNTPFAGRSFPGKILVVFKGGRVAYRA